MKPFDLRAALRGKQVVTRSGRKVTEIKEFTTLKDPLAKRVVFAVEGEDFLRSAFGDGCCLTSRSENKYDLFMQMEKKFQLVWQHTDGINRGVLYFGSTHTTRKAAEELAVGSAGGNKKFMGIFEYEE